MMELHSLATHLFAFTLGTLVALVAYSTICINIFNEKKEEK